MNKSNLKSYAPQARKDFIAAVTARAHLLGLDVQYGQLKVAPSQTQGDVTVIAGQAWPAKVDGQRQQLIARMQREGFAQTVEAVAYTWFNRFAALRYMELHDYLGHGHRALSSREGGLPEILAHASELAQAGDLPGLKASQVNELKLAGNRDGELYRLLLIAQCNALHQAMPFLFEHIDDETELLLPDNLLLSDSVIAKLVAEIPEEDWAEVEIIGWLYQFYISEKKAQVIGKVVKSEDIPAATQLFTPNWIVQYLVQNSVGRLWLMANPGSTLASQWPYYIQPAEQTPEVQAQLDALIQTRVREDGETLNPETITLLDPACGSGHILVVAYDVLKAIYLERGYQPRAIPRLILEKNLYGLDIDDRAAQMAGFALLMKARADDRRLFNEPPKLNVLSLQGSAGLNYEELCMHLAPFGVQRHIIWGLIETFEHAKNFGSLIQIPYQLKTQLEPLAQVLSMVLEQGDLYALQAARDLQSLVLQAEVLGHQFDAVVANPPYMGSKGMNLVLKDHAKVTFPDSKSDLFAMFMERGFGWCKPGGFNSMVTMQSWMFLSSYEAMREKLLTQRALSCMVHMGNGVMGIAFGTAATVMLNRRVSDFAGSFSYCENDDIGEEDKPKSFPVQNERLSTAIPDDFKKIPGSPVCYWIGKQSLDVFEKSQKLGDISISSNGVQTGENGKYVRFWFEVDVTKIGSKWFGYNKGGAFRRWYGNVMHVVDWENSGANIKAEDNSCTRGEEFYFSEGLTWSDVTSGIISCRYLPPGNIFDAAGPSAFFKSRNSLLSSIAMMNSKFVLSFAKILNPTIHFQGGDYRKLPAYSYSNEIEVVAIAEEAIGLSKNDWARSEESPEFTQCVLANHGRKNNSLREAWVDWRECSIKDVERLQSLEEKNNRLLIEVNRLGEELTPEVPESQITLARADREKDSQSLISFAIGCMMGRYSLDEQGLIYAHAGNVGFDPSRYEKKFPADADGIVPLTDEPWFTDDAASRAREFLRAVWGPDTLEENMAWLAESLGVKGSETPDETIRRYLADKFFKDHLQTYKKRPIYWLFSSGKQGAFQALVYLHRYHEGTLARLRAEYVVPLTGKMQARLDMLQKDAQAATSTAARNKISKETEKLKKKHAELLAYDEKLRHHADMRIKLDLDDGVKVNYGKFGELLAEVKALTGGAGDD
jgi:hypothetical protein